MHTAIFSRVGYATDGKQSDFKQLPMSRTDNPGNRIQFVKIALLAREKLRRL